MAEHSSRGAPGTATRLLVLGAVRDFQPVHGYFLRRELISWRIDGWASTHPGSIYNALKSLAERGLLEEDGSGGPGGRPARTTYRLTEDGDRAFLALLRDALSGTEDRTSFLVAINFSYNLPRTEVTALLRSHSTALEAKLSESAGTARILLAAPDIPDRASEVLGVLSAWWSGELAWTRDFERRVAAGAYAFAGEEPDWCPTDEQIADAKTARLKTSGVPCPPAGGESPGE